MSISERQAPDFSQAFRGYDRAQVDEYLTSYTEYSVQVEERARKAETALAQCRRELASSPGTVGISERLASILQLANEEAEEIRERARTESEATTLAAASQAERTVNDALRQRDAIQREIDDLSDVREELLQRLIALSGRIVEATERYQGYAPGMAPPRRPRSSCSTPKPSTTNRPPPHRGGSRRSPAPSQRSIPTPRRSASPRPARHPSTKSWWSERYQMRRSCAPSRRRRSCS